MKPTPAGLSLPGRRHPCARHGSEAGTLGARRAARESARAWRVSPRRATALSGSALPLGLCIRPASCHRQPCSLFPAGPSESSAKTENTLINVTGNTALAPPERSILQRRRRLAPRPLRPLRATLRLAERPGLRSGHGTLSEGLCHEPAQWVRFQTATASPSLSGLQGAQGPPRLRARVRWQPARRRPSASGTAWPAGRAAGAPL